MELTKETLLRSETRVSKYGTKRTWTLSHKTAGTEIAGSGTIEIKECWIVCTMIARDSARFGHSFSTLTKAENFLTSRGELCA